MGNVRTALDLKQMQSLPLEMKIRKTQMRIREWYDYWKEQDVLQYIYENNLPIAEVYGQGARLYKRKLLRRRKWKQDFMISQM